MYSIYKTIHSPTAIEHSLYCNLFSSNEQQLVIAGSSQLHVYRLNDDIEVKAGEKPTDAALRRNKLECLMTYTLFGNITSLQKIRVSGSPRDSLLLSFKDAKLSMLDYDPATHELKTTSLHYFENEELKGGRRQQIYDPVIRVDPDNRCAIMMIYGTHLVAVPFKKDLTADDFDTGKTSTVSSYMIDMRILDEKITNVIDIQFLHGYYEPTLFILYEPLPTWPGRIAVRTDTCSIVALSLNMQEKVHPIIWSAENLPFDCKQVYAVPKPIGGVLVFAVNSMLYLNQSVPPYAVSLNSIGDICTAYPMKPQEGVKMVLDCCQAAFISYDRLVLSLKGGEIYVLTLMVDGTRTVRSFHFDKAASSVLTTCMTACEDGYLFLGSRLGNSLLLKYTEKVSETSALGIVSELDMSPTNKEDVPPSKKKKLDTVVDWMASNVTEIDDLDELEVYGSQTQEGTQLTCYTFEVCDSIMNIGPCGQMSMGEPAFLSEEFSNTIDPDIELVTTSGYGKNGALSVLQRSIRPQIVTTFELPGCTDMWTVVGELPPKTAAKQDLDIKQEPVDLEDDAEEKTVENEAEEETKSSPELKDGHAFLILSRDDSTMILQTGQEIMELDHSGFNTQEPTVYAGNMGNNKYIIQVSTNGVRLLEGVKQLQHIPLDIGSPIIQCSVSDPYVLVLSSDGQLVLFLLKQDSFGSGVRLAIMQPNVELQNKIECLCTYKDVSGMFVTNTDEAVPSTVTKTTELLTVGFNFDQNIDDEDELLYGDSSVSMATEQNASHDSKAPPSDSDDLKDQRKPTYWSCMMRMDGSLEIYSMPDFNLVYSIKQFPQGNMTLVDSHIEDGFLMDETPSKLEKKGLILEKVHELLLVGLGNKKSRPYLMARVGEDFLMYEVFSCNIKATRDHLQIRFKKTEHGLNLREKKSTRAKKKAQSLAAEAQLANPKALVSRLRHFEDISGYAGVFICGPYPHWCFMGSRGTARFHPMGIDGTITCFAPFHNVNCPKGFLYFNKMGELRISVLPTHLSYDSTWPVRKVPLRCTPHFITYHIESKTFTVVSSTQEVCQKIMRVVDEERAFVDEIRDERFIWPTIEKFSLQLFSPVSWEAIPNTKIEMDEMENITALKPVYLRSEETHTGLKCYIAVGTNYCHGEEITSRGRILIFSVIEVVPEPGQPLTKNKIKMLYDKEQKGPVTALTHVEGFLVGAIGQKIYIWTVKDNELSGIAFIDTQIYIHTMTTIKNLILIGDLQKSIGVLRFQEDLRVLSHIAKDIKPMEVFTCEFLVDNTQLGFLVTDAEDNLMVYMYLPEVRESAGGNRLLKRADINIGTKVNTMFRIRCKLSDPSTDKRAGTIIEKRHTTFLGTLDGGINFLLPIAEKTYRRFQMLQNMMLTRMQHLAGLNPKAFRLYKSESRGLTNPQRNIIDGDLLWKFIHLSELERNDITSRIGTSSNQIMDDLMELDRISSHF